jgi:hypothetical protein
VEFIVISLFSRANYPHILDCGSEWTYRHVGIWVAVEENPPRRRGQSLTRTRVLSEGGYRAY